jgi:hypothetical protein
MGPYRFFYFTLVGFLVQYGSSISETDREVLQSLYNTTGGFNWLGWDFSSSLNEVCNWKGILCDSEDKIIELQLGFSEYQGSIPSNIGRLTSLSKLLLYGNKITG